MMRDKRRGSTYAYGAWLGKYVVGPLIMLAIIAGLAWLIVGLGVLIATGLQSLT
jgi:hypothetical protein